MKVLIKKTGYNNWFAVIKDNGKLNVIQGQDNISPESECYTARPEIGGNIIWVEDFDPNIHYRLKQDGEQWKVFKDIFLGYLT